MATQVSLTPSVLLVIGELREREMYTRTLRAAGYHVIEAQSSSTAYRIATLNPPDIIVTNVHLRASINGLELTRRLRNDQRTFAVGIIVLTIASRPQDTYLAIRAGASSVLEKPVPASILENEISLVLLTSRQMSSKSPAAGQCLYRAPLSHEGRCPWCYSELIYRDRFPLLDSDFAAGTIDRDRLRCLAGWFCANPACHCRRLSNDATEDISSKASSRRRT